MWLKETRHFHPPLSINAKQSRNHTTASDSFLLLPSQYLLLFNCFVCFFPHPSPTLLACKNNWKGRRLRGKQKSTHRYTTLWVKKGGCWGCLSWRLEKVTVWPADKWGRSRWTSWGLQMSILKNGGLWTIIKDQTAFSCQWLQTCTLRMGSVRWGNVQQEDYIGPLSFPPTNSPVPLSLWGMPQWH